MEAMMICPTVPTTDTKTVLNTYREKGTQEEDSRSNRVRKLSRVGRLTKIFGG